MNKLNESLFSGISNLDMDDDVETNGVVPSVYADAINTRRKTRKELENRFKEQEKEKDAFIKDNHKTDRKPRGTKEMKKMKLSESLFESNDVKNAVWDYVDEQVDRVLDNLANVVTIDVEGYDADWCDQDGQSAVANKLVQNKEAFINSIVNVLFANKEDLSEHLESDGEDGWGSEIEEALSEFFNEADAIKYEVQNCRRGSYSINGEKVSDLIYSLKTLSDMLSDVISNIDDQEEILQEDASEEMFYKKKRKPLADIIMDELTWGETVFKPGKNGRFNPTYGPSLNLDESNIGANSDENGEYIIAWVPDEATVKAVEDIANKYNRESKSGSTNHVKGNKLFVKIYLNDEDWDEPYFDPNVKIYSSKKAI